LDTKRTQHMSLEIQVLGLVYAQKCGGVKPVNETQTDKGKRI